LLVQITSLSESVVRSIPTSTLPYTKLKYEQLVNKIQSPCKKISSPPVLLYKRNFAVTEADFILSRQRFLTIGLCI